MSERDAAIAAFLRRCGWSDAARAPLAGDASFRRYERLTRQAGSAVLMDAPPGREDVRPFVRIARLLGGIGLSAPKILAEDAAAGFVLLEDLGDATFTRVLAQEPRREAELYALATDALIALHRDFRDPGDLPRFDDGRAIAEAERMLEWLWPATFGGPPAAAVTEEFRAAWRAVLPAWRGVADTLILFDYHVDNLLWLPRRAGAAACGLLDFQDAVIGPLGFDLMSLLQDVRRDVPDTLAQAMIARYLAAFPALDRRAYAASYAVGGAQRNIRILGTFVRLWKRDGKPGYLRWMPRVWRMVESNLAQPALAPLDAWFQRHLPPAKRGPLPGAP
jgi:N-acetylmuramate 1-kinase